MELLLLISYLVAVNIVCNQLELRTGLHEYLVAHVWLDVRFEHVD